MKRVSQMKATAFHKQACESVETRDEIQSGSNQLIDTAAGADAHTAL